MVELGYMLWVKAMDVGQCWSRAEQGYGEDCG